MKIPHMKLKKYHIFILMIIASILIELMLYGYYTAIKKRFTRNHLIGNIPTVIETDALEFSEEPDDWGNKYIRFEHDLENVYNIELVMKEYTEDAYIRVLYDNENGHTQAAIMQKADKEEKIFKSYFSGIYMQNFQIAFYKDVMDIDNIKEIRINDNLQYVIEPNFSFIRIIIYFTVFASIYLLVLLAKHLRKKEEIKIKKEYAFIVLGSVIGIVMCFTNVILSKYDEHAHFWRAYEISDGTVFSGHSEGLPSSIFDVVINEDGVYEIEQRASYANQKEGLKIELNPEELTSRLVGASGGASPISYIPQTIGVTIGRLLKLNPLMIATAGRITNLISYLVLMFLAIKILPKEKWKNMAMIIGLLPMSMNLAASLSPDAIVISTLVLAVSYIMKLKFGKNIVRVRDVIILATLFTVAVMCKMVYFPLILMVLLIPEKLFKNKKKKILYTGIIALAVATVWILWQHMPAPISEISISTSTTEQKYFTLSDPLRDLYTLGNTIWNNTDSYIGTMLGGWNSPHSIMCIFGLILLIATFDNSNEKINLKKGERIFIAFLCLSVMLLIYAGLYITWTRAQWTIAQGIQGRYFLPILIAILITIEADKVTINIRNRSIKYIIITLLLYIPVWTNTIQYFSK